MAVAGALMAGYLGSTKQPPDGQTRAYYAMMYGAVGLFIGAVAAFVIWTLLVDLETRKRRPPPRVF
jgi:hypothetical protein